MLALERCILGSVDKWHVRPYGIVKVEAYHGHIGYGKYGWTVVYQGIPSVARDEDLFDSYEAAKAAQQT